MPLSYGGDYLEAMDSHGSCIAFTRDVALFATAVDGSRMKFLKPETLDMMLAKSYF